MKSYDISELLDFVEQPDGSVLPVVKQHKPVIYWHSRRCNRCGVEVRTERPVTATVFYCSLDCAD